VLVECFTGLFRIRGLLVNSPQGGLVLVVFGGVDEGVSRGNLR